MRIAYQNLLSADNMTTTSEHGSYPLENVVHRWKKRVYRTAEGTYTATITAVFDGETEVNSFFALFHNCSTIEVRFYDYSNVLVASWNGSSHHGSVVAKTIEIEVVAPTDVYIGLLYVGPSLYYAKSAEQDMPLVSSDAPTFSSDYQVSGRVGSVVREGEVTIPLLTSEEREALEEVYYRCGLVQPFFLDLWDKSDVFVPLYGVFTSSLSVSHFEEGDTVGFSFREVN